MRSGSEVLPPVFRWVERCSLELFFCSLADGRTHPVFRVLARLGNCAPSPAEVADETPPGSSGIDHRHRTASRCFWTGVLATWTPRTGGPVRGPLRSRHTRRPASPAICWPRWVTTALRPPLPPSATSPPTPGPLLPPGAPSSPLPTAAALSTGGWLVPRCPPGYSWHSSMVRPRRDPRSVHVCSPSFCVVFSRVGIVLFPYSGV